MIETNQFLCIWACVGITFFYMYILYVLQPPKTLSLFEFTLIAIVSGPIAWAMCLAAIIRIAMNREFKKEDKHER